MKDMLNTVMTGNSRRIGAFALIFLGIVLLLASVTGGFTAKGISANFVASRQTSALVIGVLAFLGGIALLIMRSGADPLPDELEQTISERVANLSGGQRRLLTILRRGPSFMQSEIEQKYGAPITETFYRLEHLRLLGLITREDVSGRANHPLWKYKVTDGVAKLGPVR